MPPSRRHWSFALPHPQLGETVAAAVVLHPGATVSERELQAFTAAHLADFKVPVRIVFLEEIPKGPTGKPQRIGLAERLGLREEQAAPAAAPVAPRTAQETALAALWAEILGVPQVGIFANFFALGGDSLLAAQIVARLRPRLTTEFNLHHFLASPTIAEQASLLGEHLLPESAPGEADELDALLAQLSAEEIQQLLTDG